MASIIDDSKLTCDEIIEKTNNPNKCCSNKLYFSKFQDIVILLITIVLLIAVVIYCSLIKYKAKQKKKKTKKNHINKCIINT